MLIGFFYWLASKGKPVPLASPLPFAQEKAPPGYPPLAFFGCPHASLFVIHQDISGPKIFCNFFRQTPLLDPWFCTSSFKNTNTLSFTVRSRLNAAWSYQRQHFAKTPGWCEAAALPAPGPCTLLGQVKAYPGLKLSPPENKNK